MSNSIIEAKITDIDEIRNLANKIWPPTFKEILSPKQIEYMLEMMYSSSVLEFQMKNGHQFFLIRDGEQALGFMGIQTNHPLNGQIKIHKLYVLPNQQGKGLGKLLLNHAKKLATRVACKSLVLNVNRHNKAVDFYLHYGFEISKEEDIDIGNGFFMNDFVMEFAISQ